MAGPDREDSRGRRLKAGPIPVRTLEHPLGFTLRFEGRGDYLHVRVDGEHDTFEISLAYWTEVARACAERGTTRVMVVENLQESGDPLELERLIDAIVALGFREIRLAFVDLVQSHLAAMEHGEILARERGIAGRVFGDEASAERWLRYGVE
jgi:hypothetical protein